MQTVSLTLQLRAPMHARLAERASERGWKPTDFALQLLEAAYAARCQHDRGEESGDAKLDRAVRDVFLMADCEPEYIAAALDLPQSWVEKILEGWRRFDPLSRSPAAPPKGKRGGATRPWTEAELRQVKDMWAAGKPVSAIAAAIGRPAGGVQQYICKKRSLFPRRRG
jgi:hypothetical protein